ncbi:tautomerase family protein [Rhizobium sp. Leaf371]|uniref:tautomerase family protein n=1 Tax=Rhizobium sp. Leaf371 TaxID=1736355 RepID=UPI0009EB7727|nr:tautomerase family protein [Rhizobium sp. Leaf371]
MPIITCDIRNGRTKEQKSQLAKGLSQVLIDVAGVSIDNIFVVTREMPGFNFLDAGEHVPDYVPGPNGEDVAGAEQLRQRAAAKQQ